MTVMSPMKVLLKLMMNSVRVAAAPTAIPKDVNGETNGGETTERADPAGTTPASDMTNVSAVRTTVRSGTSVLSGMSVAPTRRTEDTTVMRGMKGATVSGTTAMIELTARNGTTGGMPVTTVDTTTIADTMTEEPMTEVTFGPIDIVIVIGMSIVDVTTARTGGTAAKKNKKT